MKELKECLLEIYNKNNKLTTVGTPTPNWLNKKIKPRIWVSKETIKLIKK